MNSNLDSDLNPDSELFGLILDSESRINGWVRIQLDSDSRFLDSDLDSWYPDSHITGSNVKVYSSIKKIV